MPFYFPDKEQSATFAAATSPRLISVFRSGDEAMVMPRVMHKHDDNLEIVLILRGQGQHVIGGRAYLTGRGDILVYNAGVLHDESTDLNESLQVYYCSANQVQIQGLPVNQLLPVGSPAVIHCGEALAHVETLFSLMVEQTALHTPQSMEIAQQSLAVLLLLIRNLSQSQIMEPPLTEPELGQQIKAYIDQNYPDDLTLAAIAEVFHINPYYLSHLFKEQIGFSPMQYLIRRRIGEAQSLLIHSDRPVKDIATAVGFNHLNNFHNSFQKMVGMAPGRYRKQWHEGDLAK
ncbi:MAG: AraC family transcriptional regulator [Clostridia bacterium]|nr:AraC family transcriptional regulator [Clostridia bacterium]NCC75119.1 AraC family transcriptional regulator [Clostridia bacterium]